MAEGVDGLLREKSRPPGTPVTPDERTAGVIRPTPSPRPHEAMHRTLRAMGTLRGRRPRRCTGFGRRMVRRVFRLSRDPAFVEKLHDIVGLYVSPPAYAVVLSVDEKSQIRAPDRTQPGLPPKKGRGRTMTHDDKRNGTTKLFAAPNVLTGEVFGRNMGRHRHQEFIRFLNAPEHDMPAVKAVHVVPDNVATHNTPEVMRRLERHPRRTFRFTPISALWPNAVEGFFVGLTGRRLKHGVFCPAAITASSGSTPKPRQNPSPGAPIPTKSSPPGIEGSKCRNQSTRSGSS